MTDNKLSDFEVAKRALKALKCISERKDMTHELPGLLETLETLEEMMMSATWDSTEDYEVSARDVLVKDLLDERLRVLASGSGTMRLGPTGMPASSSSGSSGFSAGGVTYGPSTSATNKFQQQLEEQILKTAEERMKMLRKRMKSED